MNGLYLSNYNIKDFSSGVSKKIRMQLDSFENLGVKMDAPTVFTDSIISKIYTRMPFTSNLYDLKCKMYLKKNNIEKYDFVYIRHNIITKQLIANLRYIRNKGIKVFYEIPTYPYDRNENDPLNYFIREKDRKWRSEIKKVVDYVVDFSGSESIYGAPTIVVTNGVNINLFRPVVHDKKKQTIDLIAVALMAEVHGFDRVIEGMHNYYVNHENKDRIVRFHIVGDGAVRKKLQCMVKEYGLTEYVTFYGFMCGDELDRIYDACDIGVGVLGIHRRYKGQKVSSLKTKEYAAKGLPFINGENDDAFIKFKYSFEVESNDDPLNIEDVIKWYERLVTNEDVDTITQNIRGYARDNLTWDTQLKKIIERVRE